MLLCVVYLVLNFVLFFVCLFVFCFPPHTHTLLMNHRMHNSNEQYNLLVISVVDLLQINCACFFTFACINIVGTVIFHSPNCFGECNFSILGFF